MLHHLFTYFTFLIITTDQICDVEARIQGRQSQQLVQGKIVGGFEAGAGAFPYFAVSHRGWICGGTLIHSDIIMSAAHCGADAWSGGARIGSNTRTSGGTLYNVTELRAHERYNSSTTANDIMLIRIERMVPGGPFVQLNPSFTTPVSGADLTAIGFGYTQESGPGARVTDVLRQVNFLSVSYATCKTTYPGLLDDLMVCNGSPTGGKDTCMGDSGGPVLLSGTDIQIGITSYGFGCGRIDVPAVNTRVSAYIGWIQEQICEMSAEKPAYCFEEKAPVGTFIPPAPAATVSAQPVETCLARDQPCTRDQHCCSNKCFGLFCGLFGCSCQM